MSRERSPLRVGLMVLAALVALAVGVFFIGDQSRLFARKNDYYMTSRNVAGLNEGNPVRLNGVTVGVVEEIDLPQEPEEEQIRIEVSVESRYEKRIRRDSRARIRTLGLLGDKYVEITSGSMNEPEIPPGGRIPTEAATNVDRLIASGEDVMDNLVAISHSFRNILGRIDRGEGFVGELTTEQEGQKLTESLREALDSINQLASTVEEAEGPLPRLIKDRELADRMTSAVTRLDSILAKADTGPGLLPAMLDDPDLEEETRSTLADLRETAASLQSLTSDLEDGDGLAQKLLTDEEYGDRVSRELETLVENLSEVARKLNQGEGTAARMINDPQVYQAVEDIIVGVNESKILRWLIRNRQKKGIEKRYEESVEDTSDDAPPPGDASSPPSS
ncbi:MAG: MlaD family protein [Thermoanaerobaculia bacterium]|nr:MlaD family protein [Thermoanaerobaculia bacterium]